MLTVTACGAVTDSEALKALPGGLLPSVTEKNPAGKVTV
jgi:hypothetical protein